MPSERRVLARGDGLAALDRAARRRLAEDPDGEQIGRDRRGRPGPGSSSPAPSRPRVAGRVSLIRRRRLRPPRSDAPSSVTLCSPTRIWPLSRIVGVALTPAATAWRSRLGRPSAACPVATQACQVDDVEAGRGRDRGQPVGREGALVLAGSGWRRASPGTASSLPCVGGAARAGARPRPIRRTENCSCAPWKAASWWTIRSVPGVTYLLIEGRLDGPRELAADGALEVGPDLERHRGVGLADGPAVGERGRRRRCGGSIRSAASGRGRTTLREQQAPR